MQFNRAVVSAHGDFYAASVCRYLFSCRYCFVYTWLLRCSTCGSRCFVSGGVKSLQAAVEKMRAVGKGKAKDNFAGAWKYC